MHSCRCDSLEGTAAGVTVWSAQLQVEQFKVHSCRCDSLECTAAGVTVRTGKGNSVLVIYPEVHGIGSRKWRRPDLLCRQETIHQKDWLYFYPSSQYPASLLNNFIWLSKYCFLHDQWIFLFLLFELKIKKNSLIINIRK